jgi:hypothetical protein
MLDEMRHFGYSSNRTANPLKLVIWGPGHIEVSTGGIALIYRAGGIFEETPLRAADLLQALARSVETELTGKTRGTIESLDHVFGDLIQEIGRLGHGGLLLVTKVPKKKEFFSWRKTHGSLLQKLLIKYWDDVATLTSSAGGLSKLLSTQSHPKLGKQFLTVSSDTTMLQNCVGAIATLAGMDGAIVMDHGCNVVAFNAIISKTAKRSRGARVVDEIGRKLSEKAIVGERGSRHQSALAYVKRVPNSFAFVISQDGGVSAFHNQGDGTVRYEGGLRIFS